MLHCEQNTGYAIKALEHVFFSASRLAGYSERQIFWSYNGVQSTNNPRVIHCNYDNPDDQMLSELISKNNIRQVIAFDLGYPSAVIAILKKSGVRNILSYWGASMSAINSGIKLLLKKIEYTCTRYKPDHFIFESAAMQATAVYGRGVPANKTSVIYLGVDTSIFTPEKEKTKYTHSTFNIEKNRHIVFYSGHMEHRKGVHVIVQAAIYLAQKKCIDNIHFVICGNKGNEADIFLHMLDGSPALNHVTFAGYRNDIPELMRSCDIGVIASTGWDSFTMSSVEMMASGLPLIVSNLQGLSETISPNENGWLIEPGDHEQLANYIYELCSNQELKKTFSMASRKRAVEKFDVVRQIKAVSDLLNE
jgi:glycosyltransferase involved in cell wall biosynthesis